MAYFIVGAGLCSARKSINPTIGWGRTPPLQSTTINIVDKGNIKKSYSFNFAGGQLTYAISTALGIGNIEAEELKNKEGLVSSQESIAKSLYLLVDPLILETRKVLLDF